MKVYNININDVVIKYYIDIQYLSHLEKGWLSMSVDISFNFTELNV